MVANDGALAYFDLIWLIKACADVDGGVVTNGDARKTKKIVSEKMTGEAADQIPEESQFEIQPIIVESSGNFLGGLTPRKGLVVFVDKK